MNLVFWKSGKFIKNDNIKKSDDSSVEDEYSDAYSSITKHLKILEDKAKNRADKISNTLSLIENLTDDAQIVNSELSKERDIWKATFDSIPSLLIILDTNFKIQRVNSSFISFIDTNEKFIIGRYCKDIIPKELCDCNNCPIKNTVIDIPFKDMYTTKIKNKYLSMTHSPIKNTNGELTGHVILFYDITDRVKLQKTMEIKDSVMTAINKTTERMLRDFKPTNGQRVEDMIVNIGIAAKVSRSYVFKVEEKDGNTYATQTHEWTNNGITPQLNNQLLQNLNMTEQYKRWVDLLKQGHIVHGHIRDFPDHERQFLIDQEIKSILVVPVLSSNKLIGILGFDECTRERVWTEQEITALQMASNILSAWIDRTNVEKTLRKIIDKNELERKKLGEYLIDAGYITREQLNSVLKIQQNNEDEDNLNYVCVKV